MTCVTAWASWVAAAPLRGFDGVFTALGLSVGGSAWRRMQDHIVRLGLDTSHWIDHGVHPGRRPARRPTPLDDDALRAHLPAARPLAEVIRAVGLDPANGSDHRRVRRRIDQLGLPRDHLLGQAWRRGATTPARRPQPLEEVPVEGSSFTSTSALRDRLVGEGVLSWRCARCGAREWHGERAPLQLDHVNGDPTDNRRENLRLLCPNCHAQTPTYCGRNIGNRYSSGSGGG